MKKIMIIGSCGAGKSTLAKAIHEITNIPLIHLDQQYFGPNWVEPETEPWTAKVTQLANQPSWIIDGNYGGTMEIRMQQADTILFLDRPTLLCLYRILKRTFLGYGKTRADMAEGCNERFDHDFIVYVFNFNKVKKPAIEKRLAAQGTDKKIIRLKSQKQIAQFLSTLQ